MQNRVSYIIERKNERVFVDVHATLRGIANLPDFKVPIADLSTDGCRLIMGNKNGIKTNMHLSIYLPILGQHKELLCLSEVCWSRIDKKRGVILGVRFVDEAVHAPLNHYLHRGRDRWRGVRKRRSHYRKSMKVLKWVSLLVLSLTFFTFLMKYIQN